MQLLDQYQEMHKNRKRFPGFSLKHYINFIIHLVEMYQPQSLLDYGCGKGLQYSERKYHEKWGGLLPAPYDPAVPQFSTKPTGTFDGVICTDVLEHVPESELPQVLLDLSGYANKFVFVAIATFPSKKILPNGMNAHVTVKDTEWWMNKIHPFVEGQDWLVAFNNKDEETTTTRIIGGCRVN